MSDDSVFSRWSRRKRKAADAPETPDVPEADVSAEEAPEDADASEVRVPETPEEEAALLEELGLPVPETLVQGDDFKAFMKAGVPEFLRKRALRTLWRSNPVLANLDGLNDYDEDFRSPEMTKKVLATAYQVGRGFVRKEPEADEATDAEAETEAAEPVVAAVEVEAVEDAEGAPEADVRDREPENAPDEDDGEPVRRPGRMRFET